MITITLKDLIYIVPDLINLFLSGFIFMRTYTWLNSKKSDISLLTVESLFISFLIKSFYTAIHSILFSKVVINNSVKVLIYSLTGYALAVFFTYLKQTKLSTNILYRINNKSVNDDIFDDVIDYELKTTMRVFLKSSDIYYIGRFFYREERGNDSWICLINYCSVDKNTNEKVFDPEDDNTKSSVVINFHDIERIELFYENDSKVWKWMNGKN